MSVLDQRVAHTPNLSACFVFEQITGRFRAVINFHEFEVLEVCASMVCTKVRTGASCLSDEIELGPNGGGSKGFLTYIHDDLELIKCS